MKTLVMHTLPPDQAGADRWEWEFDLHDTAAQIAATIPAAVTAAVRGDPAEMLALIAREQPSVIFNLCEAPLCDPRLEPHAAALFEWLRLPFTGARSETLALCRRKDLTKRVLAAAGVRVPRAHVFPCIVKPLDEDGSAGIYADSVCESERELARAVARVSGPVLIEEFVPGREFVVSMWGHTEPECAVVAEIVYGDGVRLLTYEGKWDMESHGYVNAPLVFDTQVDSALRVRLVERATRTWEVTGLRGYGTVDLRLDAEHEPCVIDVNPNAALNSEGRLYRAAEHAGWTWDRFVRRQIEWAS